jgi:hypothetical protein
VREGECGGWNLREPETQYSVPAIKLRQSLFTAGFNAMNVSRPTRAQRREEKRESDH